MNDVDMNKQVKQ